jgi:cbb3-type cytochrome oxidase maturation protein
MSEEIVVMMLGVSVFLGALGLVLYIWGLKTGQFDDQQKLMQGVLFDNEEDLNRLAKQQNKKSKKVKNHEKNI